MERLMDSFTVGYLIGWAIGLLLVCGGIKLYFNWSFRKECNLKWATFERETAYKRLEMLKKTRKE